LFLKIGVWNAVAGSAITAPVLIPRLAFPILLTQWGSEYILIGYFVFIFFGIIGPLCWSTAYYLTGELGGKKYFSKEVTYFHAATTLVSAYGASSLLFLGGYIGTRAVYIGEPIIAAGALMESVEIPAGLFIGLAIISTLIGVANLKISSL